MFVLNNIDRIEETEKQIEEQHVVIILLIKPSDVQASEIISQFNYYHHLAGRYCSIYAAGFMQPHDNNEYPDKVAINSINNSEWCYSDKCFIEVVTALEKRLAWDYCGEPQIIILQNNPNGNSALDFRNYVALDLGEGVRKSYIESIPRLLTSLIKVSKKEVTAYELVNAASRIKVKNIVELALESAKQIPEPVRKILKDRAFYIASKKRGS